MSLYRDDAIVLRTQRLGEADRIVTLLTRNHGRIRAVAKGVRRTKSRFGARLEPFSHIDVQLHQGRSLDIVTQVESLTAFGAEIVDDYSRWTVGQAILETAERLSPEEHQPQTQQYLLLVGALRALSANEHDGELVLDAFLLRSLSVAGWAPSFDACVKCGQSGPHPWFHVPSGGALCSPCRIPGSVSPSPEVLELLAALLTGEWNIADASDTRVRREASGIVAAHLQWHLERGLRSLPLVHRA